MLISSGRGGVNTIVYQSEMTGNMQEYLKNLHYYHQVPYCLVSSCVDFLAFVVPRAQIRYDSNMRPE